MFVGTASSISLQDSNYTGTGGVNVGDLFSYTFTPTVQGANTATVTTTFSDGGGSTNSTSTVTTTLSGTGVAPIESVANSTVYGRIGSGSVANGTITVANTGNGNLAGTGTAFNLNGSISSYQQRQLQRLGFDDQPGEQCLGLDVQHGNVRAGLHLHAGQQPRVQFDVGVDRVQQRQFGRHERVARRYRPC